MDELVGAQYRSLTYQDWIMTDRENKVLGEWFHKSLAQLRPDSHPDDDVHDRFVGATLAACRFGNVEKAITLYNRWALTANYRQAIILSTTPPLVDIGDAIVSLNGNDLDVLKVKP